MRAFFFAKDHMGEQSLRIALAQINCMVGDLEGNCGKILQYIQRAQGFGVDIIAFPELAVTGYPPEDLLLKTKFIADNITATKELSKSIDDSIIAIVGFVDRQAKELYNAAAVMHGNQIKGVFRKVFLPNYGVFDEKRYFSSGQGVPVFGAGSFNFGVNICEDIWHEKGPTNLQAQEGARIIFNINASPYHMGKGKLREAIIRKQARDNKLFIVYTNLVGGQDELVFDGQSMVVDPKGRVIHKAEAFKESLLIADVDIPAARTSHSRKAIAVSDGFPERQRSTLPETAVTELDPVKEVYQALRLGLHDYVLKNGFKKVVIGLSGGIDSSIVACLAVDALGKDNCIGVFMASRYSSSESEQDAVQLAENLGIRLMKVAIEPIYKMYLVVLEPHFIGSERDITEENLQARIRGNILMAFSNKFGWLVLTTGNKSEMSTGYATLYGDMAGGFAVIKDVPKTLVYTLSRYRNSLNFVIPERVMVKPPTAELKPNQKDSDTLPLYETLDPIVKAYVEEDEDLAKIVSLGFDKDVVARVLNLVDRSEYKRRQAPPGIKITPKAFGRDRRMPITNKYRSHNT
jgi:NAD+ synthase (glutamine-hydrolysing)